eukprot:gene18592-biopygen23425
MAGNSLTRTKVSAGTTEKDPPTAAAAAAKPAKCIFFGTPYCSLASQRRSRRTLSFILGVRLATVGISTLRSPRSVTESRSARCGCGGTPGGRVGGLW